MHDKGKEILAGFFEDRPEEYAESVINHWPTFVQHQNEREQQYITQRQQDKLKHVLLLKQQKELHIKMSILMKWKINILKAKVDSLTNTVEDEKMKYDELESSHLRNQIELREVKDLNLQYEDEFQKAQQLKQRKKVASERRKKMKNKKEASKSLSMEKAGRTFHAKPTTEDPYMVQETHRTSKVKDLEKKVAASTANRAGFLVDQRGSINTQALDRRKQLVQSRAQRSVGTASIMSHGFSEFSFHPEINHNSKWKPKYDDHHDHKHMFERMHKENSKIQAKKRIMSREKEIRELSECTFTPKMFTHRNKSNQLSVDSKSLGDRMYEYADKFKNNLQKKKLAIEQERGQEICFVPKTNKNKNSMIERPKGEVYEDLYNDHNMRSMKMQEKVKETRVIFKSFTNKLCLVF